MSRTPKHGTGGGQDRERLAGTERPAKHSKLGGTWTMLVLGAAILVLLLVFILTNTQRVEVHLYGAHATASLGTALVLAAALGILLVVVPGGGRIIQLRRATKRLHREREHFAGRLDEVAEATAPGDEAGGRAAQTETRPQAQPQPQQPAEQPGARDAGAGGENPADRDGQGREGSGRKRHWWSLGH